MPILDEIKAQIVRNGATLENKQTLALCEYMAKNGLNSGNLFRDVCIVKFVRYGVKSFEVHREWCINPKLVAAFQSISQVK